MTDVIAGRYALIDPIGAGGSGTVWRAFDIKRSAYCAAKLLRQRDAGELLRFVREQSVRLDHPHIVSPYSWAAEDGTVLIASELVAGGSLHTLLGDYGPLAESTVVTALRQVLAGLGAVHDVELIHRDVKPANVLVQASGTGPLHLVLTDFGLTISRRDARLTQVGMVIGTPGYLPPEVLLGGVPPDPRHDLYAAGRLALTLLAGQEPDRPAPAMIAGIGDPVLRATVEALVRHDPQDRPPDAVTAVELLAAAVGEPTPRTRDGDPVDVLDQLPPLPPGWTGGGPVGGAPADPPVDPSAPSRATVIDVALTAPVTASAPVPSASVSSGPVHAGPATPVTGTASVGRDRPTGPDSTTGPEGAGGTVGPGVGSSSPPTARIGGTDPGDRARRRRGTMVAGAAVGVAAITAAVLVLPRLTTDGPDGGTTPGTTSNSVSTPATSPVTTAGGSTPTGPTSSIPIATATVPPTSATLSAGDTCTWQQEGDRQVGVDGLLVCGRDGGTYAWRSS